MLLGPAGMELPDAQRVHNDPGAEPAWVTRPAHLTVTEGWGVGRALGGGGGGGNAGAGGRGLGGGGGGEGGDNGGSGGGGDGDGVSRHTTPTANGEVG